MDTNLPLRSGISDIEWEARIDLAAAFRLVDIHGWSDLLATHLSARVPNTDDHFLINPFGMLFEEITASSLIKIDGDGNILSVSAYGFNPAGFVIHSAVHTARNDAMCVFHTHTEAGVSVATQEEGLLPFTQHALAVLAHTGYHDYEGIAMDVDERAGIAHDLADNNILILRNHGLLTVGQTVGEAFMWLYRAERACRMQVAFQKTGARPTEISEEIQEATYGQNRFNNSEDGYRTIGKLEWPALLRKLDRIDRSYKA